MHRAWAGHGGGMGPAVSNKPGPHGAPVLDSPYVRGRRSPQQAPTRSTTSPGQSHCGAPPAFREAMLRAAGETRRGMHRYMANSGSWRRAGRGRPPGPAHGRVRGHRARGHDMGAAGALNCAIKALRDPGDGDALALLGVPLTSTTRRFAAWCPRPNRLLAGCEPGARAASGGRGSC